MGDTKIEWTDRTWNPVRGCSRVSAGCQNCYAERQAIRQINGGYKGLIKRTSHGPAWTGDIRIVSDLIAEPLRWRQPRRVFVNSMSDLFHDSVPESVLDRLFAVMALAQRHTFQVLTKRPARMLEYLRTVTWERLIDACNRSADGGLHRPGAYNLSSIDAATTLARFVAGEKDAYRPLPKLPLPNVQLGVSVESQETADERIPPLLQTPAATRFVSYEPALGPVDFRSIPRIDYEHPHPAYYDFADLDWVIVGGESGPGARPCDIDWIRSAIAQCKAAGVACFVKQLGANIAWVEMDGRPVGRLALRDRKGGDMHEWPEDLRVREFPR